MLTRVASLAALVIAAIATEAPAQQSASINLAGVQLRNAVNVVRDSAPQTIAPAARYHTVISGNVRGQPILSALWLLFPTATPLAQALDSLAPGSSAALDSYGANPTAPPAHPFVATNQTTSGTTDVGGTTVTYSVTIQAGINAANNAYFSLTNVVLTPSTIGYLVFDNGSAVITRIPCPVDIDANGQPEPADIAGMVNRWFAALATNPPSPTGDYNLDGLVTPADIAQFVGDWLGAVSTGCPS